MRSLCVLSFAERLEEGKRFPSSFVEHSDEIFVRADVDDQYGTAASSPRCVCLSGSRPNRGTDRDASGADVESFLCAFAFGFPLHHVGRHDV